MLTRRKRHLSENCTRFRGLFDSAFGRAPAVGSEFMVSEVQWTFVSALPIMKKINHLGEICRVPLDLKSTINLPRTAFPMKANLPQNEPKLLTHWEQIKIYERIREARQGVPTYV